MMASWSLALLVVVGDGSQPQVAVAVVVDMVVREVLVLCLTRLSVCSPFQLQQG